MWSKGRKTEAEPEEAAIDWYPEPEEPREEESDESREYANPTQYTINVFEDELMSIVQRVEDHDRAIEEAADELWSLMEDKQWVNEQAWYDLMDYLKNNTSVNGQPLNQALAKKLMLKKADYVRNMKRSQGAPEPDLVVEWTGPAMDDVQATLSDWQSQVDSYVSSDDFNSMLEELGGEIDTFTEEAGRLFEQLNDLAEDFGDETHDITRDTKHDVEDALEHAVNVAGGVAKDFWVNGVQASMESGESLALKSKGMTVESSGPSAAQIAGYTAAGLTVGVVGLVAVGAVVKAFRSKAQTKEHEETLL